MSENTPSTQADATSNKSKKLLRTPRSQVMFAFVLFIVAGALALSVQYGYASYDIPPLTSAVVVFLSGLIGLVGLAFFLLGIVRWAVFGFDSLESPAEVNRDGEVIALLDSINDRLLISDTAKRIAYREQDRETLRRAIREDISKGDFEAALVLVSEMSQAYGYRREAEQFRDEIITARDKEIDQQVSEAIAALDRVLTTYDWDRALREAGKIQRLFPDSPRVKMLDKRVRDARDQHKRELEREFFNAAQKDDIEQAMRLLKELDRYLTEQEAEPFRETARGVIGKKRQNLGVQFKMAVHDHEWTQAVVVGEQIIREFPNTKMADEVRSMLDLLRERSAGEQAARPREMA
ncbi:MAG: hypothetical protein GC164_01230 [Phycisphaera sp.]|nr:hypothetical protein [Phycisphaera sp.]